MVFEKNADELLKAAGLVILLGLAFSIAYWGMFDKAARFLPTWDNSMLHAGRAVFIMETGHYAEKEVVFGGVTPTYHLPAYPALVAGTALLTGLDFAWTERLLAIALTMLLAFAFYAIAKGISGDWRAGVIAAILALSSTNLMTWGTRNSPIGLGNALLPIALYLLLKRRTLAAFLCALVIALDHQPTLLVFAFSAFLFFLWEYLTSLPLLPKAKLSLEKLFSNILHPDVLTASVAGLAAFLTYMAWHVRQTGLTCLNFSCLPQFGAKEFGKSIDFLDYFSKSPQAIALLGILLLPFSNAPNRNKALAFAWLFACILLVKNDLLGIGAFTERFLTYLDGVAAVFAGVGIAIVLSWIENEKKPANG
jgi:hypothetical protein